MFPQEGGSSNGYLDNNSQISTEFRGFLGGGGRGGNSADFDRCGFSGKKPVRGDLGVFFWI